MSDGAVFAALKDSGIKLDTIYDIGAHKGTWSTEVKEKALPNAEFFLFEANPVWREDLERSGFRYFLTCLSSPGRTEVEFVCPPTSGATYYRENTDWQDGIEPTRMPCETIDAAVARLGIPPPDAVKLDTQGSELDILAGASIVFENANVIQTEAPLFPYNIGAPKISDYLDFMRERSFFPCAMTNGSVLEGVLVQVDLLFMRRDVKERFFPTQHLKL